MQTVLITGASQGLGRGFVEELLDAGARVFAGVRSSTSLDDLAGHEQLTVLPLDVSDDESIQQAVAAITTHVDHLDMLINNAGVNKDSATNNHKELVCAIDSLDRASLLAMFDVNTIGPMMVLKQCKPLLTAKPSFVINVSSCRASFHDKWNSDNPNYGYSASKVALNMMTARSVYDMPKTIQTFAVHPGDVHTSMNPAGETKPRTAARHILDIASKWDPDNNGKFFDCSGELYPL